MKLYCNSCFSKTEYKFSKPKFCPECGFQTGTLATKSEVLAGGDLKNIQKIKDLEKQLSEFRKEITETKGVARSNVSSMTESGDESDDDYDIEDYAQTQRHINNFKRNAKRSGVIVERNSSDSGISFGQLIENSSTSKSKSNMDFQMKDDADCIKKTHQQILEEIRLEASSISRPIEID